MPLVLTRREVCRRAILEVMAAAPNPWRVERRVTFVTSFAEAHRVSGGPTTCVIDLASVTGSGEDVVGSVHLLLVSRPGLNFVLLAAHTNPELENRIIHGLRDVRCVSLMHPRELRDVERWTSVLEDQFVERHAITIEADLRACSPNQHLSSRLKPRRLLRLAVRVRKVGDLTADAGDQRVGIWRRFKRRWGRAPSEMLSLFRLLWAAHLRNHGHSSADIARLLGFRDTQHCARRLGARLGMRKSDINRLTYQEVVGGVAACLVHRAPIGNLVALAGSMLRRAIGATALLIAVIVGGTDTDDEIWRLRDVERRIDMQDDDRPHPKLQRLAS
jgi:AraC-like DNA-binding protein